MNCIRLVALAFLFIPSGAVRCGKWFSNACLGETDVRYDPDYTNTIKDQNPIWAKQEGFWIGTSIQYDGSGNIAQPQFVNPMQIRGDVSPYSSPEFYLNLTIVGSRLYSHNYLVLRPPPQDFCNQTVPAGLANAFAGQCGVNGFGVTSETCKECEIGPRHRTNSLTASLHLFRRGDE